MKKVFRDRKPFIYLASRSARRRELLKEAGFNFKVVSSNFKERTYSGGPSRTVVLNAVGKVKRARIPSKRGIVLGADTMIYFKKKLIGKPKSMREAFTMLKNFSGSTHYVYTGIVLFNLTTRQWNREFVRSKIKMRKFTGERIRYYLNKVNPLDKAGAYAIQERGDELVENIKGSYTNVIGLPMEKLKSMIAKLL